MRGVDGTSEFLRARSHKRIACFVAVFAAIVASFPVAPVSASDEFEPAQTCVEMPIVEDAPTDSTVPSSSTTSTSTTVPSSTTTIQLSSTTSSTTTVPPAIAAINLFRCKNLHRVGAPPGATSEITAPVAMMRRRSSSCPEG